MPYPQTDKTKKQVRVCILSKSLLSEDNYPDIKAKAKWGVRVKSFPTTLDSCMVVMSGAIFEITMF